MERLRPRLPPASLVFGQVIHQSLTWLFQGGGDPVEFFVQRWTEVRDTQLKYAYRESWEKLLEKGQGLLELFVRNEAPRLGRGVIFRKKVVAARGEPVKDAEWWTRSPEWVRLDGKMTGEYRTGTASWIMLSPLR